jgi:hypothetical protein
MQKRIYVVVVLVVIIAIVLGFIFYLIGGIRLSPGFSNNTSLEVCKSLHYNSANAINIVFFSDSETTKKYADSLLNIKPFSEHKDMLNFYYIENYTPTCVLYKDAALFCYTNELIKKAASCPNDYIVVLENQPPNIRSSSYMNVMSINKQSQMTVFAHEFGHSFAVLDEEYVPATLSQRSKNCKFSCYDFGNASECFKGCSDENYNRQYQSGIMRTLYSDSYGSYDEQLIAGSIPEEIEQRITGNAVNELINCSNDRYFLIEGRYKSGEIEIINKSIEIGCSGSNGNGRSYSYNIEKNDGSYILNVSFNPGVLFTDVQTSEQETISGEVYVDEETFYLRIPALSNCNSLSILNGNKTIAEIILNDGDSRPCRIR